MECLVLVTSTAIQGARPHSKPPFRTTLFDGVGAQVALGVAVVCGTDEEVACDVREEAGVVAEDLAEVVVVDGFFGGCWPECLERASAHQLQLHSWQGRIGERFLLNCYEWEDEGHEFN